MLSNLKLRGKMILGYVSALTFVLLAMVFGIMGLLTNVRSFDHYSMLADETELAREIDSELLASRLAYKKFMTTNDQEVATAAVNDFELAYEHIMADIGMLRMEAKAHESEGEFRRLLQQVELDLVRYSNYFSETIDLDDELINNYNNIAAIGYRMIENLEFIQESTYVKGESQINNQANMAHQNLLRARLHASKYFDFHTEDEYEAYQRYFYDYEANINNMESFTEAQSYSLKVSTLQADLITYRENMTVLYEGVTHVDEIEQQMDSIGPVIYENVEALVKIISEEMDMQRVYLVDDNNEKIIQMAAITAVSVLIFLIIMFRLIRMVLTPIESLTVAFGEIAHGEADTAFRLSDKGNDEIGQMSRAFNRFMVKLGEMLDDIRLQSMIKTGQNDIHEIARDEEEMRRLSSGILEYVIEHAKGLVGRIYIQLEDNDSFQSMGSYGLESEAQAISFKPMEGLVGNCVVTGKLTKMQNVPEDYMKIRTGLGDMLPTEILLLPCKYNDEVNCVLEIGRAEAFEEETLILLAGYSEEIGNIVHSAELRANMRTLLDKTINQAEELQMQQEELRQSNEELEEQTRALKESEQRLQAQQEELRVSNEELEERSKQLEMQKAALDEKNKAITASQDEILEKAYELEQANRYKSEFLANMSHELRTPLNSILVLSQLLSSRDNSLPLNEKESEFANTIHTSGTDLLTLINGVLDLSKVEAGRMEVLTEKLNLVELLGEYDRLFTPVAQVKKIDFVTALGDDMPDDFICDRLRLSQVIKNLISNAIKFTHDGHVALKVRRPSDYEVEYTGLSKASYIAFEVRDTGIGIEAEKKEVIFEAFMQEDGTTSRTYGGTGLGLTISLEMAKLLGGDIVLESEVGVGSQFVLILPEAGNEGMEEKALEPRRNTLNKGLTSPDKGGNEAGEMPKRAQKAMKAEIESVASEDVAAMELPIPSDLMEGERELLIIEDDETFGAILASLAEEKGYNAVVVGTGYEGLKIAKEDTPAAVILDMGLPDMDGMEVARKLEEDEKTRDIPIHIISGRDLGDQVHMPKSIIGFLKKPVDIKSIYQTLSKIETVSDFGLKRLLVVGNCGGENFEHFTNLGQVEVVKVETGEVALEALKQDSYGCIVLDTKLEDMTGVEFIKSVGELVDRKIPVIIYTDEDINFDEYEDINQHAESIIVKSEKSQERLTDEVTLFLHDMNQTIEQYEGTVSKTLKANVKLKIEEENSLAGKKVLLVDDDERNVFALLHALEQYGLEVTVAKDGYSAIDRFTENKYLDIILMDIMMPKMDGYEAIGKIRAMEGGSHIPIVALTAKAMAEDRERCIAAGANDYMTKPIDIDKLMSLMKVWMT